MSRNTFRAIEGVSIILKTDCANDLYKVSFTRLFIKIGFDLVWSNPMKDFDFFELSRLDSFLFIVLLFLDQKAFSLFLKISFILLLTLKIVD
jgi:hypothetical protein